MKTSEIAELVGGKLRGDGAIEIRACAAIERASSGEIAFLEGGDLPETTGASCVLVPKTIDPISGATIIAVDRPKLAFARVAAVLHPPKARKAEIHPTAVISASATIGKEVFIGAFVCVGKGSRIGDRTELRAGAKVGDNVEIGGKCVLNPNVFVEDNSVIGNDV